MAIGRLNIGLTGVQPGGLAKVIPSSVAVTGTGATGTVDSNGAVIFSGASTLSLNGCFTSTYKTYKIVGRFTGTGQLAFYMKLRASNTDASSAYYWSGQYQSSATTSEGGEAGNNLSYFQIGGVDGQRGFLTIDLHGPFETATSHFTAFGWDGSYKRIYAGGHGTQASYDGFTVYPNSGTISGIVSVYGYAD